MSDDPYNEFVNPSNKPFATPGVRSHTSLFSFYGSASVLSCSFIFHHEQTCSKHSHRHEHGDDIIAERMKHIKSFKDSVFGHIDTTFSWLKHGRKNYDKRHTASNYSLGDGVEDEHEE